MKKIDRRKRIVDYLENPTTSVKRKISYRALSYTLMDNKLSKKTPKELFLKCLSESEAFLALSNVHNGACRTLQVGHKMKWILFR